MLANAFSEVMSIYGTWFMVFAIFFVARIVTLLYRKKTDFSDSLQGKLLAFGGCFLIVVIIGLGTYDNYRGTDVVSATSEEAITYVVATPEEKQALGFKVGMIILFPALFGVFRGYRVVV